MLYSLVNHKTVIAVSHNEFAAVARSLDRVDERSVDVLIQVIGIDQFNSDKHNS